MEVEILKEFAELVDSDDPPQADLTAEQAVELMALHFRLMAAMGRDVGLSFEEFVNKTPAVADDYSPGEEVERRLMALKMFCIEMFGRAACPLAEEVRRCIGSTHRMSSKEYADLIDAINRDDEQGIRRSLGLWEITDAAHTEQGGSE